MNEHAGAGRGLDPGVAVPEPDGRRAILPEAGEYRFSYREAAGKRSLRGELRRIDAGADLTIRFTSKKQ